METKDVFDRAKEPQIKKLLDEWTTILAIYIVNIKSILDSELFVIGGSVIVNNPYYLNEIEYKANRIDNKIKIVLTSEFDYNSLKGAYLIDE